MSNILKYRSEHADLGMPSCARVRTASLRAFAMTLVVNPAFDQKSAVITGAVPGANASSPPS